MNDGVRQDRDGRVAILVIDAPPVNALGAAVRTALMAQLSAAMAAPDIGAVVIRADGRTFSAGADIREFGQPDRPGVPSLPDLCRWIEDAPKPVIAAIDGAALGGGFELALACHLRLAAPGARFGLPEVTLGLLPGAGGTQRLPRLIGAAAALRVMLGGAAVPATEAVALGMIDAVVEDGLAAASVALASELAQDARPPRRTCDRTEGLADADGFQADIARARRSVAGDRLPAPGRIVDCVEAALLLPFGQGLDFERAAFADLRAGPQSAALRHVFLAERRALRFPEAAGAAPRIGTIAVIGLGRTGSELAFRWLRAGYVVRPFDRDSASLTTGLGRVADLQDASVAAGRMPAEARDVDWERFRPAADLADLAEADVVVEALPEDADLKLSVLGRLIPLLRAGTPVLCRSGWLDLPALAAATGHVSQVVGYALTPPDDAELMEIAVTPGAAPAAVAVALGLAKALRVMPLRVAAGVGFVAARLSMALWAAAEICLEDGATPAQVDAAFVAYGFSAGPFLRQDNEGLERVWLHRQRLGIAGSDLGDLLVGAGRLGRETGRGYYRYGTDGAAQDDPEVLALLEALRRAKTIGARTLGRAEIMQMCLTAAANEAARLLEDAVVPRASDIDVAAVSGSGWPRWEGGPLHWAAGRGLIVLRADLVRLGHRAPALWSPAPLIDRMLREGRALADVGAD